MRSLKLVNMSCLRTQIVSASVVHLAGVSPDAPAAAEDWNRPARLRCFSLVRRLDGQAWPPGEAGGAGHV